MNKSHQALSKYLNKIWKDTIRVELNNKWGIQTLTFNDKQLSTNYCIVEINNDCLITIGDTFEEILEDVFGNQIAAITKIVWKDHSYGRKRGKIHGR